MTSENYRKLNKYLNTAFKILQDEDQFLLGNSETLDFTCDDLLIQLSDVTVDTKTVKNNLTFNDVFLKARNIIKRIDANYLKDFDNLIKNGTLNFSYTNEYRDSEFIYYYKLQTAVININREFNYQDVILLVHEFFHYTSGRRTVLSENWYLFTEFIAIFFELNANKSLKNEGVSPEEMNAYFRLNNLSDHINAYQEYSSVLTAFTNFGYINDFIVEHISDYFDYINKEDFEKDCTKLLKRFEKIEEEYRMEIMYDKVFNEVEFAYRLSDLFKDNYRYILGIMLAFYANDYCTKQSIIDLNDNINKIKYFEMDKYELLNSIGIDLNEEDFTKKVSVSIKRYVKNIKR